MGKDAGGNDLEAGALTAWTPAQQAALYHLHLAKQVEADEDKEYKESVEKEEKEKRGEKEEDKVAPEGVQAGKVVDDLVRPSLPFPVSRCIHPVPFPFPSAFPSGGPVVGHVD